MKRGGAPLLPWLNNMSFSQLGPSKRCGKGRRREGVERARNRPGSRGAKVPLKFLLITFINIHRPIRHCTTAEYDFN